MKSYPVASRSGVLSIAALLGAATSFLFWRVQAAVIRVVNEDTPGDGLESVVTSLFLLLLLSATIAYTRKVVEIRITDRGKIVFVRAIGSSTFLSKDAKSLHGRNGKDYDGRELWALRFVYGNNRREEFGQFPNVLDFVEEIRARNPRVEITGLWPMDMPVAKWPQDKAQEKVPVGKRDIYSV